MGGRFCGDWESSPAGQRGTMWGLLRPPPGNHEDSPCQTLK